MSPQDQRTPEIKTYLAVSPCRGDNLSEFLKYSSGGCPAVVGATTAVAVAVAANLNIELGGEVLVVLT